MENEKQDRQEVGLASEDGLRSFSSLLSSLFSSGVFCCPDKPIYIPPPDTSSYSCCSIAALTEKKLVPAIQKQAVYLD